MGCDLSKLKEKAKAAKGNSKLIEKRILFLGLDNAGKTSILLQLKDQSFTDQASVPTIGLNIENVKWREYDLTLWDVGGGKQASRLWKHYFDSIDLVLFVVDSSDKKRLFMANEMLGRISKDT